LALVAVATLLGIRSDATPSSAATPTAPTSTVWSALAAG
jgi:hypothetical protein